MVKLFIFYDDPEFNSHIFKLFANLNNNVKILGTESKITKSTTTICNLYKPNVIISKKSYHKILKKYLAFNYIPVIIEEDILAKKINRI